MSITTISVHELVASQIDKLSRRKLEWLTLPEPLESRFERDTSAQRSARLSLQGLIAILLFNVYVVVDFFLRDGSSWISLLLRVGVVTPFALIVNASMRWNPSSLYRESSIAIATCLIGLSHIYLESNRNHASSAYAQVGVIVAVIFANVVMQLQLPFALFTSLVLLGCDLVFLRYDHILGPSEKLLGIAMTLSAIIMTLIANHSIGREERLSYLMQLRSDMQSKELSFVNAELQRISTRDNLTGLANRHSYEVQSVKIWRRAVSTRALLSAIVIDIDRFKAMNDLRGHLYGDQVLTRVASLVQQALRGKDDFAARFGGEEFVVLLPGTTHQHALLVAERIRTLVEVAGAPAIDPSLSSASISITVSCGVATCTPADIHGPDDLLDAADKALYQAKGDGRNRVCSGTLSTPAKGLHPTQVYSGRIRAQSDSSLRAKAKKMLWG